MVSSVKSAKSMCSSALPLGWQVQFLEAGLEMPLPRKFTFADPEKIRELPRRGIALAGFRP